MNLIKAATRPLGRMAAAYLSKPIAESRPVHATPLNLLRRVIRPGDVLLIEGRLRLSAPIKYLTQSSWSHAALAVGDAAALAPGETMMLIEADLQNGVIAVPLAKYESFSTRICRPVGLSRDEIQTLVNYAIGRLGHDYDLANVIDLIRYLAPTPPAPSRFRRRMIALGSGEPTRAICSTLIAQAFQHIRYPILPEISRHAHCDVKRRRLIEREVYHIRHHSLYTPADFDLSPYFQIVKPTLAAGFDPHAFDWDDNGEFAGEAGRKTAANAGPAIDGGAGGNV